MNQPDLEKLDTRSSQATLLELEPSPVEETPNNATTSDEYFPPSRKETEPKTPPHPLFSRTSNLGLSSHGPAFYRTCSGKAGSHPIYRAKFLTNDVDSLPHPEILILCLLRLPNNAHRKHRPHPTSDRLGARLRVIPAAHTAILPIDAVRGAADHGAAGAARKLRHRAAAVPAAAAGAPVRGRELFRAAAHRVAARQRHVVAGVCAGAAGRRSRLPQSRPAAHVRRRQRQRRAGVRLAFVCALARRELRGPLCAHPCRRVPCHVGLGKVAGRLTGLC